MLGQSKITLNFPDKPDGTIQAKSRIYEAMLSGALLLEKSNDAITKLFEPMKHYVPFDDENDLLNKITYYLQHEEDRNIIVDNAMSKMKTDYSSEKWWTTIFERAI
jgi:spore maturation protein CgeB